MRAPEQRPLFVLAEVTTIPVLSESERQLIDVFREARTTEGAARSTIDAEVSQLRTLRRELIQRGTGGSLLDIVSNPALAGGLFTEPSRPCHKSTWETRLRALQRLFLLGVSPEEGRRRLDVLDGVLPMRSSRGWHDAAVRAGGQEGRVIQRPTLGVEVLRDIFDAAANESVESEALAGLLCFSAIPLASICALQWGELSWGTDRLDCTVTLGRGRARRQYLVTGPAAGTLIRLYVGVRGDDSSFVFPGRTIGSPLTTRAARGRMAGWASTAGQANVTRHGLTSALAESLRAAGLDDPSTQLVLGRRQTRSVDRMLAPHRRLENQRRVQASLSAILARPTGQDDDPKSTNSTE